MTANLAGPIFAKTPNFNGVNVTAANTKSDGTGTIGTDIFKAATIGADGAFVSSVDFKPTATVAGSSTTATVARAFASSKTSGGTTGGTDTFQIGEATLATQVADSSSAATFPISIPINKAIPANWTILVTTHAAPAANTSWQGQVTAGDY